MDRLSDDIADVGPLLFGDLVGRDRDIYLQHIGDDPTTGWYAFAARTIDSPRDCFATWEAAEQHFTDSCSDTVYDETGDGLPHYPVSVSDDGQLSIDINADNRLSDN